MCGGRCSCEPSKDARLVLRARPARPRLHGFGLEYTTPKSCRSKATATASKTATSGGCQPTTQRDRTTARGVNFQPALGGQNSAGVDTPRGAPRRERARIRCHIWLTRGATPSMPAREEERRMEPSTLIGRSRSRPRATAPTRALPRRPTHRRTPYIADTVAAQQGLRFGCPLRHVDGTSCALPACWAGEDPRITL